MSESSNKPVSPTQQVQKINFRSILKGVCNFVFIHVMCPQNFIQKHNCFSIRCFLKTTEVMRLASQTHWAHLVRAKITFFHSTVPKVFHDLRGQEFSSLVLKPPAMLLTQSLPDSACSSPHTPARKRVSVGRNDPQNEFSEENHF